MRSRIFAATSALAVLALTAGCTGDGEGDRSTPSPTRSATPVVPSLPTAWTAPAEQTTSGLGDGSPRSWTTATAVVVYGKQSLSAFAPVSGTPRWTLDLPEPVCRVSREPNADGVLGLLLGNDDGTDYRSCRRAAAVDLDTGKLLWTSSLAATMADYGVSAVATGPKTVAFTNTCNSAVTLSVRDGSTLARFPRGRTTPGSCGDAFASDGRIVVDGREANGRGGANAFVGSDAVTGRQLWSIPVTGNAAYRSPNIRVNAVVSADPPIIDAELNGHRFLRTVDPDAGRITAFGREAGRSDPLTFAQRRGDTLVAQYRGSSVLFAFDARSGAERARTVLADNERVAGTRGASVVTIEFSTVGGGGVRAGDQVVRQVDPMTGTRRILGRFALSTGSAVTSLDDTLVVGSDTSLVGLRLPTRPLATGDLPDGVRWVRGDLTPRKAKELCVGITPTTRRALSFVEPALPVPATCQWVESLADGGILQMYISVRVSKPAAGRSAVQVAHRSAVALMAPDKVNNLPATTPVTGIGDEAGIVVSDTRRALTRIVVRRANVVLLVDLTEDASIARKAAVARLSRGLRLVAADLVAEIDRRR